MWCLAWKFIWKVWEKSPSQFFDSEGKRVIASFCKRLILVLDFRRAAHVIPKGGGLKIFLP